jgi:diaminopimelate epimerase
MKFTKLQSAGNDFVLVEGKGITRDWQQLAKTICKRHFGVGGDGLLVLLPSTKVDITMRLFNANGSEAEACGNGLRCLVKYAIDNNLVDSNKEEISVETMAGIRKACILEKRDNTSVIQAGMGKPELEAARVPVVARPQKGRMVDIMLTDYPLSLEGEELRLSFLAMGNPHAVCFQQQPVEDFPLLRLGPLVENNQMFLKRINFEVARIIDRRRIDARVWERGVGETLACGSGACAVAVAAQLLGFSDNPVSIRLLGGTLEVDWDREGEVLLSGVAESVFSGEWLEE